MQNAKSNIFSVGTSLLNPAKPFMDLWSKVNKYFTEYKLHIVPFDDNHTDILNVIEQLGNKFDFLIGVCDSKQWLKRCNMLPLGRYKKMISVSKSHRLANKKLIDITDLYGETLMMVKEGDSYINDFIRQDLRLHHPQINIKDTPHHYDLSVFNYCAETDNILLCIECWANVHPELVTIPVDWNYTIPYGLLYSLNASDSVKKFISTVENNLLL